MTERIHILENADPVAFYGVNNVNMQLIKTLFPKLRIVARGNVMKVIGEDEESELFLKKIREIEKYCEEYGALGEEVILDLVKGNSPPALRQEHLIIYGINGRPIVARNENQQLLASLFQAGDLVFAIGPAGTGKTFVAIALAVRALKNREVKKIILSRPAVEAGEKLGFLPGEMKDKLDPYLQPLYDALMDMIPAVKLREYMENNIIQIAPLAYMRGRTLSDAVILLDEAQNTTAHQIKMFLTRLGTNAKMVITGDITQIDLPAPATSGLLHALRVLKGVPGIGKVEFNKNDIVRHKLVQRIVEAYERFDKLSITQP
jgi:phosphate starvation-inducible PhoH-like protein